MKSALYRKLMLAALVLVLGATWAIDYCIVHYSGVALRERVAMICLGSAAVGLSIAYRVSRSLSRRVSKLKAQAQDLLQNRAPDKPFIEPDDELGALEHSLTNLAAQVHDLLDRWRFESARRDVILSSMAEGVLAVDRQLRVIFCNYAMARAVGFRTPVPERLPFLQFIRDADLQEILSRVISSGTEVKKSLKISAARGRYFEVQAAPLDTPDGRGAVAILHDITDLERVEQIRKDFVANVSHELRTPLANIVGCSDTLLDGALDDANINRRMVEIIRSNATRLNNIASDLLVLSELESGEDPGEPDTVSVGEALNNVFAAVQAEADRRGITLIRDEIVPAMCVTGHKFGLEQALLNLITNAVRFNRRGGEVRVGARSTEDGQVAISVADNGVGIPSQDLPRIFERFYRVDKARSREVGGTGLGLSITRHVIERMSGKISVESQLGKGSTFTILLPPCYGTLTAEKLTES
ncbi:MAG TPA: ATP-binding protein [Bryobacteraceae bacterium]|nr:ATP-binding protein [Bryobacteraceae bacterium]